MYFLAVTNQNMMPPELKCHARISVIFSVYMYDLSNSIAFVHFETAKSSQFILLHACSAVYCIVDRGGFRGVSEVSGNHSGFSLDNECAPFRLQHFTRHTQRAE